MVLCIHSKKANIRGDIIINTNITNFRKNIEEGYNGLIETVYLSTIPGLKEDIVAGMDTPLDECLPEEEVKW